MKRRAALRAFATAGLGATLAACCAQASGEHSAAEPFSDAPRTPASSPSADSTAPAFQLDSGSSDRPQVALTFHGQGSTATAADLLRAVEAAGARITVLAVGTWLDDQPASARRVLDGGHELGNHTMNHGEINAMDPASAYAEIARCAELLTRLTGSRGRWFRPSQAKDCTPLVAEQARRAGYDHCLGYDLDSLDHTDPGPKAVARTVLDTAPSQHADTPRADSLGTDTEKALAERVETADGFAQVFPEHKYRIVRLLQARGHIVGMTGDGVNDAPALKQADAGIAVSGATDAARAAADVVLLAPGLSVIVDAIRQAREIFARMTSYATYRIAETIRVLLLITLAIVAVDFFPVTPIMIVFLALLNDGAILSIAYDHVRGSPRPAAWDMRTVLTVSTTLGLMGVAETFVLFALADQVFGLSHDLIRTLIYLKLSVSGHLTIFVTRTRDPFWSRPRPAPILLGAVLGTQVIATVIAVYGALMTPLGWGWAAAVWGYALFWFLVEDRVKLATCRWLDHHPRPTPDRPSGSAPETSRRSSTRSTRADR